MKRVVFIKRPFYPMYEVEIEENGKRRTWGQEVTKESKADIESVLDSLQVSYSTDYVD